MRKIIGIGETILDIIFKNGQPTKSLPGGSVFNTMVSLGRLGVPVHFITEVGRDQVGEHILSFMQENNISTKNVDIFCEGKSPVSLAFLDENNEARYLFYTQYPENRLSVVWPRIDPDDILILGSYYAVNPSLRPRIIEFLEYARERKAIIYYDPNFRKAHAHEAMRITPALLENLEYADIVRGSTEDFETLFHLSEPEKIYLDKIKFYCPNFICTQGAKGVELFIPEGHFHFDVPAINPVSTIGAGDNFNAGLLFGILQENISRSQLENLPKEKWEKIISSGINLSIEVCNSYDNYISTEFASTYRVSY